MKRMILVLISMVVFGVSAQAQQGPAMMGQRGVMPRGAMMSNVQVKCPMMDMMQSMTDVMKIEQKLLSDVKGSEKRELRAELEQKMAVLDRTMADMKAMQMPCMTGGPNNASGSQFTPPCMQYMQNGRFTPPCLPGTVPPAK